MAKRTLIYLLLLALFFVTLGATISLLMEPTTQRLLVAIFWICVSYLLYKKVERSE